MYLELDKWLTPEQKTLKDQTHRFAAEVLRPASAELDKLNPEQAIAKDSVFWDALRQAYGLGLHLMSIPEQYGGSDLGPIESHIVLEELGWGSSEFAVGLLVATAPFSAVAQMALITGNEELVEKFVRPYVNDTQAIHIGSAGVTEPAHGSDAIAVGTTHFSDPKSAGQCRARLEGDEWVITGQKASWVSFGSISTFTTLSVTIDPRDGMAGGGLAVVPLDSPGVSRGKPWDKLGKRAQNQGEIFFDGVRIPKHYMCVNGAEFEPFLRAALSGGNSALGALYTGVARAAYEEALTYSQVRVQGGRPICEHQLIKAKLFSMFTKVELARALSRAVMKYNMTTEPPAIEYSTAAKVSCTQFAYEVADDALKIFGATGLSKGMLVEKLFRDARMGLVEDGANDFLGLMGADHILEAARGA